MLIKEFRKNKQFLPLCFSLLIFTSTACSQKQEKISNLIRFNQLGFYPTEEKIAIVVSEKVAGETYQIRNSQTNEIVKSANISTVRSSIFSDKKTCAISFDDLTTPGSYLIEIPSIGYSSPFIIKENLLKEIALAGQKAFYYQRMSMPIEEQFAGIWNRPSGHPDNDVMIHASAASDVRPEGTIISSTKGWYDAGDYNKYIVNSGFTLGVLLSLYEDFPEYIDRQNTNIPESGNNTPDLLDEIYWNIAWMLTMQDPNDGGVYHKLTTPRFEGFIKPTECKQQRYVVAKSVTAALDFAASMAQASRIYKTFEQDYPGLSEKMINAARRAFEWAKKNPEAYYKQDELNKQYKPAISTGTYGDNNARDEFFWAAVEIYITTKDQNYLKIAEQCQPDRYILPVWSDIGGLGNLSLIRFADNLDGRGKELVKKMKAQLLHYADSALQGYETSPYNSPYGRDAKDFFWGCNSDAASNQGMTFIYAWKLTDDNKYLTAALHNMDYILGRNATGYCYVTGYGTNSTKNPHHRLSVSDDIKEPIPGFLAGGPNPGKQDNCNYPSDIPDECYADVTPSYASNEIAINWQGLFTYFSTALDAIVSQK